RERLRGVGRAVARLAVDDHGRVAVGDVRLDARLEVAAGDVDRAGDEALFVFIPLAHVDEDGPGLGCEPLGGVVRRLLSDLLLHRSQVIASRNHRLHLPFPLSTFTRTTKSTNRMDPNFPSERANVGPPVRIPTGRRRLILVAVVALVAGGVAAAAVIATRGGGSSPATTSAQRLSGQPPLVLQLPGAAVGKGNAAVYAAARQRLPAGDVRLSVARAIMAYDPAHRARTVAALERLPQRNPAVAFALGMAQLWAGDPKAAEQSLERVKQLDPYGYYGTNADNLLHLNREVTGYPPYFPPTATNRSL